MPNFSSLARLEEPEKFLWWVGWGGVCKVIFVSNPTVVLRLGWGWGFDKSLDWLKKIKQLEEKPDYLATFHVSYKKLRT